MGFSRWKEYLTTLVLAVGLALLVRNVLLTAYKVPTGSMQPTLKTGDFIFTYRPAYGWKIPLTNKVIAPALPHRGDVVVFSYPQQPQVNYVKRVVALPGDRVEIKNGRLILNGEKLAYSLFADAVDNPNPDEFEIFHEKDGASERAVIFEKNELSERKKNYGPVVISPGEIFLLGDNRDTSDDSRYWGAVPMEQVIGQVLFIWLSLDPQRKWGSHRYPSIRWERLFSTVH